MAGNEEFYKNSRVIFSLGTFFPDTKVYLHSSLGVFFLAVIFTTSSASHKFWDRGTLSKIGLPWMPWRLGLINFFPALLKAFFAKKKSRATKRMWNISDYFVLLFLQFTQPKINIFRLSSFFVFKSDIRKKKPPTLFLFWWEIQELSWSGPHLESFLGDLWWFRSVGEMDGVWAVGILCGQVYRLAQQHLQSGLQFQGGFFNVQRVGGLGGAWIGRGWRFTLPPVINESWKCLPPGGRVNPNHLGKLYMYLVRL